MNRRIAAALLAVVAGLAVWQVTDRPDDTPPPDVSTTAAAEALPGLPVTDRLAVGYQRAAFGNGWIDADHDGCDTRAEVLMRDLASEKVRRDPSCLVLTGNYRDPYTGIQGEVVASTLDVDHLVSLADAWRTGASTWTDARRVAFANDPANLVAVNASVNRSKSDKGPDEWQPPSAGAVCSYAARYVAVKADYGLAVTAGQRDALAVDLAGCPR